MEGGRGGESKWEQGLYPFQTAQKLMPHQHCRIPRDFYLAYCEAGFDEHRLHLWQVELAREEDGYSDTKTPIPAAVEAYPCADARFAPHEVDLKARGYEPSRCPPSRSALRRWAELMPARDAKPSTASMLVELAASAVWTMGWAMRQMVGAWVG